MFFRRTSFDRTLASTLLVLGTACASTPDVEDLEITFTLADDLLPFVRGDSNTGGSTDLADAIFTLKWIFSQGRVPKCMKSVDTNGDGIANIADPIVTVFYLFLDGREPAAPFPDCGRAGRGDRRPTEGSRRGNHLGRRLRPRCVDA